jgi:glutathione S-transferase
MGPYCKFCDRRCFVERYLTNGPNRIVQRWLLFNMATCQAGMAYDQSITGQTHRTAINPVALQNWLKIGHRDDQIRRAADPPFDKEAFRFCRDLAELEQLLRRGGWPLGTALAYGDLCLILQVEAGDKWLAIRHAVRLPQLRSGPRAGQWLPPAVPRLVACRDPAPVPRRYLAELVGGHHRYRGRPHVR